MGEGEGVWHVEWARLRNGRKGCATRADVDARRAANGLARTGSAARVRLREGVSGAEEHHLVAA